MKNFRSFKKTGGVSIMYVLKAGPELGFYLKGGGGKLDFTTPSPPKHFITDL